MLPLEFTHSLTPLLRLSDSSSPHTPRGCSLLLLSLAHSCAHSPSLLFALPLSATPTNRTTNHFSRSPDPTSFSNCLCSSSNHSVHPRPCFWPAIHLTHHPTAMSSTTATAEPPPAGTTSTAQGLSYSAPCSLPLSAALSGVSDSANVDPASNPFRVDFTAMLSTMVKNVHPTLALLGTDPRNGAYLALSAYRLLRYLIPSHEQCQRCVTAEAASSKEVQLQTLPTFPPTFQSALAVHEMRVADVFPAGGLHNHAQSCLRRHPCGHPCQFSADKFAQPTLTIDASADEKDLTDWQRWMIAGAEWQTLAGIVVEYFFAEMLELTGNALKRVPRLQSQCLIPVIHATVLGPDGDAELLELWINIGMPAACPPEVEPLDPSVLASGGGSAAGKFGVPLPPPPMPSRFNLPANMAAGGPGGNFGAFDSSGGFGMATPVQFPRTVEDTSAPPQVAPTVSAGALSLSYSAPCSLSLSAGLSIILDSTAAAEEPNPFGVDFIAMLKRMTARVVHPAINILYADPRNFSYLALANYRLVRLLISSHEAVLTAAAPPQTDSDPHSQPTPATSPPSTAVTSAAVKARVDELFPPAMRQYAWEACQRAKSIDLSQCVFTAEQFVQPTLNVDAAIDESDLSAWQRWLISAADWQTMVGGAVEYWMTELLQVASQAKKPTPHIRQNVPIPVLHEVVVGPEGDAELRQLWLTIGMPADCPPQAKPLGRPIRLDSSGQWTVGKYDYSKLALSIDGEHRPQLTLHITIKAYSGYETDTDTTECSISEHELTIRNADGNHKVTGSGSDKDGQYELDGLVMVSSTTEGMLVLNKTYSTSHRVTYHANFCTNSQSQPLTVGGQWGEQGGTFDRGNLTLTFVEPLTILYQVDPATDAEERRRYARWLAPTAEE